MTEQPEPHEIIWTLTTAVVVSRCLHVIAELGVADAIGDDAVSAGTLASACGADPDALERVLFLLAAHGVFEQDDGGFRHTPASEVLRDDHPMSMRPFARMIGLPLLAQSYARFDHSLRTGSPAVETVAPEGLWGHLRDHPEQARIFDQAMSAKAAADAVAVAGAYDFRRFRTIADIGGGRGHLLRAVLDAAPDADGILFELPHVIEALDVEHERLRPQAGDFFADALPAADAYLLMEVLHDWADPECLAILAAIRRACAPGATVLVIESVLSDREPDPRERTLDVLMLAVTGGRERTASQLTDLFRRTGFGDGRVIDTPGPSKIVEATAI